MKILLFAAHQAFAADGGWKDEKMKSQIEGILSNFLKHIDIFQKQV